MVELIVVITILAILGVIGFITFQGYTSNSRDSVRLSDIANIDKGLNLYQIKTGVCPIPKSIVRTGIIGGIELSYVGNIGDDISRMIGINKTPIDPLLNTEYYYGASANQSYYQIATILENTQAYNPLIEKIYADSNYQAKVMGNYRGYIKFNSGSELWLANIPGLIFNNTGSVELLSTGIYFVVNKQNNLPYQIDSSAPINNQDANEIIQAITGIETATLTGINITDITTSSGIATVFTGVLLDSFGGDIDVLQNVIMGGFTNQTTIANTCSAQPDILNGTGYTIGSPISENQAWTYATTPTSCNFSCNNSYVWNGTGCVADICTGNLSDYPNTVINGAQAYGTSWRYDLTSGTCNYKCDDTHYRTTDCSSIIPIGKYKISSTDLVGDCTNKPANSTYISSGTLNNNNCSWSCDSGYILNGNSCLLNNGNLCTLDNQCNSGNCDTDFLGGNKYCHATATSCVNYPIGMPWEQLNSYKLCSGNSYYKSCSNSVWGTQQNSPDVANDYCNAGGGVNSGYDLAATCTNGTSGGFTNPSCTTCLPYMAASTSSCKTSCTTSADCYGGSTCNSGVCNGWIAGTCKVGGGATGDTMLVSIGDIGQFAWGTAGVLCSSPQCSGGNLVADNAVNFSAYPARNACKTLGGRLPTITELDCIYANMASYSTYSVFLSNDYLSATEIDAIYAWHKPFGPGNSGNYGSDSKNTSYYYVRCVK